MREIIKEWKAEGIETNGKTKELEVLITDSNTFEQKPYVYEGSFADIPEALEEKKVIDWSKIIDSSNTDRIGSYVLTI